MEKRIWCHRCKCFRLKSGNQVELREHAVRERRENGDILLYNNTHYFCLKCGSQLFMNDEDIALDNKIARRNAIKSKYKLVDMREIWELCYKYGIGLRGLSRLFFNGDDSYFVKLNRDRNLLPNKQVSDMVIKLLGNPELFYEIIDEKSFLLTKNESLEIESVRKEYEKN